LRALTGKFTIPGNISDAQKTAAMQDVEGEKMTVNGKSTFRARAGEKEITALYAALLSLGNDGLS